MEEYFNYCLELRRTDNNYIMDGFLQRRNYFAFLLSINLRQGPALDGQNLRFLRRVFGREINNLTKHSFGNIFLYI